MYQIYIADGRYFRVEDSEDVLVYAAQESYEMFAAKLLEVRGHRATTRSYEFYRAKGERYARICASAILNDGTALLKVIRKSVAHREEVKRRIDL